MVQTVLIALGYTVRAATAHVVGFRDAVAPVQQDLNDLVIVSVSR